MDAQLARMLQDEQFLASLRDDPEYQRAAAASGYNNARYRPSSAGPGIGGPLYPNQHQQPQPPSHRRPRTSSAPGYPAAGGGGRGPRASSPAEESLEKVRKTLGQMGGSVKRRMGDLYDRFLNSKSSRHQQLEDEADAEVVLFTNNADAVAGTAMATATATATATHGRSPSQQLSQPPRAGSAAPGSVRHTSGAAAGGQYHHENDDEDDEEVMFSRAGSSSGTGAAVSKMV